AQRAKRSVKSNRDPLFALLGGEAPLIPFSAALNPLLRMVLATALLLALSFACAPGIMLFMPAMMLLVTVHVSRRLGTAELDELRLAGISSKRVARKLYGSYLVRTLPVSIASMVA